MNFISGDFVKRSAKTFGKKRRESQKNIEERKKMKSNNDFGNESAKRTYVAPMVEIKAIEVDVVTSSAGGGGNLTFGDYDPTNWK